jgi:hypothetical protein
MYPEKHTDCMFSGIACKLSNYIDYDRLPISTPFCIVVSDVFCESDSYIRWLFEHELKHCMPENGKVFKPHDFYLWDVGWELQGKKNIKQGFFNDDIHKIGCCDDLMFMFRHTKGIEEFL